MRLHLALFVAAIGCGPVLERDAIAALEREHAGRVDLCFSAVVTVPLASGTLLIAYQETSCDIVAGLRIGFAHRVREWDGAVLRDVGFALPVPVSTQVTPPSLVSDERGTVAFTPDGAFRWSGGEWVRDAGEQR